LFRSAILQFDEQGLRTSLCGKRGLFKPAGVLLFRERIVRIAARELLR
jgi:hypothetical protein